MIAEEGGGRSLFHCWFSTDRVLSVQSAWRKGVGGKRIASYRFRHLWRLGGKEKEKVKGKRVRKSSLLLFFGRDYKGRASYGIESRGFGKT